MKIFCYKTNDVCQLKPNEVSFCWRYKITSGYYGSQCSLLFYTVTGEKCLPSDSISLPAQYEYATPTCLPNGAGCKGTCLNWTPYPNPPEEQSVPNGNTEDCAPGA